MCYERRHSTFDEHRKAREDANLSRETEKKRDEVVSSLLREADKAGQNANAAPAKEYTPAK